MAGSKTDVAHTLADALQKIENILSDDRNQGNYLSEEAFYQNGCDDPADLSVKVQNLTIELGSCVGRLHHSQNFDTKIKVPVDTVNILIKWLQEFAVSRLCLIKCLILVFCTVTRSDNDINILFTLTANTILQRREETSRKF
jgi:hypothetical protein